MGRTGAPGDRQEVRGASDLPRKTAASPSMGPARRASPPSASPASKACSRSSPTREPPATHRRGSIPKNSPPCGPHRRDTSIMRLLSIVRPRPTARKRPCLKGASAVITRAIPDSGANRQVQIIPSRRAQASGLIFASRSQKRFGAAARKSSPRPVTPESGSTPALSSNGWAAALAPIAFK